MRWKDFLYYQQGEKIAVIILLFLILIALIFNAVLTHRNSNSIILAHNDSLIQDFERFRLSLKELDKEEVDGSQPEKGRSKVTSGKSFAKYDNSGESQPKSDRAFVKSEKLAPGETISLNETDTALWKMIPGIGSSFASRIVKYRNSLGGFVSKDQLREVYGIDNEMYSRISPFLIEDSNYKKLLINKMEFKELLSHPYLNYKQVQAIVNLRKKKGNILSVNELAILNEFTSEDIDKIAAYLEF